MPSAEPATRAAWQDFFASMAVGSMFSGNSVLMGSDFVKGR